MYYFPANIVCVHSREAEREREKGISLARIFAICVRWFSEWFSFEIGMFRQVSARGYFSYVAVANRGLRLGSKEGAELCRAWLGGSDTPTCHQQHTLTEGLVSLLFCHGHGHICLTSRGNYYYAPIVTINSNIVTVRFCSRDIMVCGNRYERGSLFFFLTCRRFSRSRTYRASCRSKCWRNC